MKSFPIVVLLAAVGLVAVATGANYTIVPISAATTTTKVASSSTLSTTTKTTPTLSGPILFNCTVSSNSSPACGNVCTNLTSAGTGVVQSPNFPGDYGYENKYCEVTIAVPVGWMIQLKFTVFNLETYVGYIDVHDESLILLSEITGNTIPALVPATINKMNILFSTSTSSKPSTAIYNWQATFSVTSQGSSCSVHNPAFLEACGNMCTNVTSEGSGVVQSRNFPGDYGNEARDCIFPIVIIIVPAGKRIRLTFTTFNLETNKAFINVEDRNTTYLIGATGSTIPAVVTTASNFMYIRLDMSSSTTPTTATYNWQATYTAV
ncbi:CUB and sushi domain-containing protein 2-like [Daphnia pulex]|uniref:CUB and sushi domain-containing protein 2-like n=1 Tax=Daphnia pulex TaxID=6669 RepID=UPI001EDCC818|nr:CUB and sushi domain-containing protein 2-like [Daphnia pulex]XP_046462664.1 CUB and sushi domain-containing protein 2-like [Daphnia pulex]XP_046462665.1 CUB and sushi domain-containing protein 2-like [Daphnia pulex]